MTLTAPEPAPPGHTRADRREMTGRLGDIGSTVTALVVLGAGGVVAGGLVAAATGPLRLAHGSWLAAYLVLVCGVAQYAFGRLPRLLGAAPRPARWGWTQVVFWNVGNVAVIVGTLTSTPVLVDAGAGGLAVGLIVAWLAVRGTGPTAKRSPTLRWGGRLYRGFLIVLVVSLPVGMVLAHLRQPG